MGERAGGNVASELLLWLVIKVVADIWRTREVTGHAAPCNFQMSDSDLKTKGKGGPSLQVEAKPFWGHQGE